MLLIPSQALPFCFDDAGRTYGISPALLRGIARVESGMKPDAINRNRNGSTDLGLMQVNTFWLKTLGTTSRELLTAPCYNVMAGAWILKGCLDRHGETWEAVGCYNASSHDKRVNYSWKVYRELMKDAKATTHAAKNAGNTSSRPGDTGSDGGLAARKPIPPVSSMEISVTELQ